MWCRISLIVERRGIVIFWGTSFMSSFFLYLYIDVNEKMLFYCFQTICVKLDQSSIFLCDLMILSPFKTIPHKD